MIEESLAEYQIAMGKCLQGAVVVNQPSALWVATNAPFPMYNGVFRSTFEAADAAANIAQIKGEFQRRMVPMFWVLGPSSTPSNLGQQLLDFGFQHEEDEPGMALDVRFMNDEVTVPNDFTVHAVQSDQALRDWVAVWAYDVQEIVPQMVEIHRQFGYHENAPWRYYLGVQNGKPVATALLFCGKTSAAVHWVVTLPEVRRQGIGTLMTVTALREVRSRGYRHAILTASPFGERIYRQIGFESYCTISKYRWTP